MLTIKKVQVIPLDENYGKIIDSFSTQDDKTKNAPSINAVENYVASVQTTIDTELENYQPIVLSGTSTPSNSLGNDGDVYFQYES